MTRTKSSPSRRTFLAASAAAGLSAITPWTFGQAPAAATPGRKRPNIFLLSADQWHADAFSHRGHANVHTPNCDRIAARSVSFQRAYATNPVCTPARASWMTGRMPSEVLTAGNRVVRSVPDLGQWFGKHGYDTAHLGKFDFPGRNAAASFRVISGIHPTGQCADLTVAQMVRSYLLDRALDKPFLMHCALMNPHDICQISCMRTNSGTLPVDPAELPPLPENFSARPEEPQAVAQRVRRSQRRAMSWSWDELDWRLYQWMYYRCCEMADVAIGQILDALESSGEAENTLLVFTSDHGEGLGQHGMVTKGFLYEASARVPLYMSLPGTVPQGVTDERLTSGIDLFPTFCNLAGLPTPPDLCGNDLLRRYRQDDEQSASSPRDVLVTEAPFHGRMARDARYKLIAYPGDPVVQLFDLQDDPGETRNIAAENPQVVKRLTAAAEQFAAGLNPVVTPPPAAKEPASADDANE
jgi:choline-sulfatase